MSVPVSKNRILKDVTITHVSYVKRGKNKKPFFFAKSDRATNVELQVKFIAKSDSDGDRHIIRGIVFEPDVPDTIGDVMTAEEIEKTAHEFMKYYRNIDTEHDLKAGAGMVVESYIAPADIQIGETVIKSGSWVLGTEPDEESWEAYLAGDLTGYSMFGISREVEVSKGENKMMSWIQKALESVGLAKSFDDVMGEKIERMSKDPYFIIGIMEQDFYKNISWDTATEEQLTALSSAMKSAAEYIDGKIVEISKSDDPPTEEPAELPADNPAPEPEAEPEPEPEPEPAPETPAEPVAKSDDAPESAIQLIVKSISDEFQKSVAEMEEKFSVQIAGLQKSIEDTNTKLNETVTKSAVSVPAPAAPPARPAGYGLV